MIQDFFTKEKFREIVANICCRDEKKDASTSSSSSPSSSTSEKSQKQPFLTRRAIIIVLIFLTISPFFLFDLGSEDSSSSSASSSSSSSSSSFSSSRHRHTAGDDEFFAIRDHNKLSFGHQNNAGGGGGDDAVGGKQDDTNDVEGNGGGGGSSSVALFMRDLNLRNFHVAETPEEREERIRHGFCTSTQTAESYCGYRSSQPSEKLVSEPSIPEKIKLLRKKKNQIAYTIHKKFSRKKKRKTEDEDDADGNNNGGKAVVVDEEEKQRQQEEEQLQKEKDQYEREEEREIQRFQKVEEIKRELHFSCPNEKAVGDFVHCDPLERKVTEEELQLEAEEMMMTSTTKPTRPPRGGGGGKKGKKGVKTTSTTTTTTTTTTTEAPTTTVAVAGGGNVDGTNSETTTSTMNPEAGEGGGGGGVGAGGGAEEEEAEQSQRNYEANVIVRKLTQRRKWNSYIRAGNVSKLGAPYGVCRFVAEHERVTRNAAAEEDYNYLVPVETQAVIRNRKPTNSSPFNITRIRFFFSTPPSSSQTSNRRSKKIMSSFSWNKAFGPFGCTLPYSVLIHWTPTIRSRLHGRNHIVLRLEGDQNLVEKRHRDGEKEDDADNNYDPMKTTTTTTQPPRGRRSRFGKNDNENNNNYFCKISVQAFSVGAPPSQFDCGSLSNSKPFFPVAWPPAEPKSKIATEALTYSVEAAGLSSLDLFTSISYEGCAKNNDARFGYSSSTTTTSSSSSSNSRSVVTSPPALASNSSSQQKDRFCPRSRIPSDSIFIETIRKNHEETEKRLALQKLMTTTTTVVPLTRRGGGRIIPKQQQKKKRGGEENDENDATNNDDDQDEKDNGDKFVIITTTSPTEETKAKNNMNNDDEPLGGGENQQQEDSKKPSAAAAENNNDENKVGDGDKKDDDDNNNDDKRAAEAKAAAIAAVAARRKNFSRASARMNSAQLARFRAERLREEALKSIPIGDRGGGGGGGGGLSGRGRRGGKEERPDELKFTPEALQLAKSAALRCDGGRYMGFTNIVQSFVVCAALATACRRPVLEYPMKIHHASFQDLFDFNIVQKRLKELFNVELRLVGPESLSNDGIAVDSLLHTPHIPSHPRLLNGFLTSCSERPWTTIYVGDIWPSRVNVAAADLHVQFITQVLAPSKSILQYSRRIIGIMNQVSDAAAQKREEQEQQQQQNHPHHHDKNDGGGGTNHRRSKHNRGGGGGSRRHHHHRHIGDDEMFSDIRWIALHLRFEDDAVNLGAKKRILTTAMRARRLRSFIEENFAYARVYYASGSLHPLIRGEFPFLTEEKKALAHRSRMKKERQGDSNNNNNNNEEEDQEQQQQSRFSFGGFFKHFQSGYEEDHDEDDQDSQMSWVNKDDFFDTYIDESSRKHQQQQGEEDQQQVVEESSSDQNNRKRKLELPWKQTYLGQYFNGQPVNITNATGSAIDMHVLVTAPVAIVAEFSSFGEAIAAARCAQGKPVFMYDHDAGVFQVDCDEPVLFRRNLHEQIRASEKVLRSQFTDARSEFTKFVHHSASVNKRKQGLYFDSPHSVGTSEKRQLALRLKSVFAREGGIDAAAGEDDLGGADDGEDEW